MRRRGVNGDDDPISPWKCHDTAEAAAVAVAAAVAGPSLVLTIKPTNADHHDQTSASPTDRTTFGEGARAMRLQRLDGDESGRPVGAAVVRSLVSGDIVLELGAADGPPVVRLTLSRNEAMRLIGATQDVLQSGGEEILIADD